MRYFEEDKHGGWFTLSSDGARIGRVSVHGDRFHATSGVSGPLGEFDSRDDARDAIEDDQR